MFVCFKKVRFMKKATPDKAAQSQEPLLYMSTNSLSRKGNDVKSDKSTNPL